MDANYLPLAGSVMFFLSTGTPSAGHLSPSIVSVPSPFEGGEPVGESSPGEGQCIYLTTEL